jgi:broad specificity phosphatase PhoE
VKNNKLTTIYFVRHGQSEANVKQIVSGHMDTPLTLEGEEQAKLLGRKLQPIQFDAAFSSDLIRAKRTAELITLEKKLAVKTTEALREMNFGEMEGKKHIEMTAVFDEWRKEYQKNKDTIEELKIRRVAPTAENDEEIIGRVFTFLREIAVAYAGKTVLVVSHGGVIYNLLRHLGFNEYHQHLKVENTAFIKLESDGVEFFIKELSGVTIL